MKTEESKYKDCNGHIIFYGDILRLKDYKRESENSPKEPFFILTKKGMYTSGMDEFSPIEVQYSKMNILEECPYCHGSYKVRSVYKESEVRE